MGLKKKISAEEVDKQVERICSSGEFHAKSVLCRLLRYLVEETLAGKKENLKEYTIGVELFNRDPEYNTNLDPMVRINIGRLRRILQLYYHEAGQNDPIRISIPKGKYIPVFLPNNESHTAPIIKNKELKGPITEPTIAILPFRNLSGDPDKEYFSLGFSEELSVELSSYEDMNIYECIQFVDLDSEKKLQSIRDLGIQFLLSGSIRLQNDQIKVIVKLSNIADGKQIWAQRYIRDLTAGNLNEIQENIAYEIAGEIASEYGAIPQNIRMKSSRSKPLKLSTYDAILKYYYFEAHQTPETSQDAYHALKTALIEDPESGIATAMLASLHGNRYMLDIDPAEFHYEKVGILAEKALELDPKSTTVRVAHAWKSFIYNDRETFDRDIEWCLAVQPKSPMRLGSIGFHLSLFGEWDRGKAILDKVMHRNLRFPLYYFGATTLYYYRIKEYDTALMEAIQYNIPFVFWGPMLRAAVYGQLNRPDEARPHLDHLKELKPDFEIKAWDLINRFVKENSLVKHVLEGLIKAGMKVSILQH